MQTTSWDDYVAREWKEELLKHPGGKIVYDLVENIEEKTEDLPNEEDRQEWLKIVAWELIDWIKGKPIKGVK